MDFRHPSSRRASHAIVSVDLASSGVPKEMLSAIFEGDPDRAASCAPEPSSGSLVVHLALIFVLRAG